MGSSLIETACDNCGKAVTRTLNEYKRNKHHFCSNVCQSEYRHKQTYEDRKCEICDTIMHVPKRSKQRFCSEGCQHKWQRTLVGSNNSRYNRVEVNCAWCGKSINAHPCKVNRFERLFCDSKCRKAWYSNVWSQRDEWRDESRERAVHILESGAISFTQSAPQVIVNDVLNNANILYVNEYNCKYFSIDNYLTESGLMIEVMGNFWHTNPILYKRAKYDKQISRIKSDRAKQTYIKNQYDVNILYLWEKDIYENIDVCKKLILEYIVNNGELDNYHSFNYEFKNDKLTLKDDLIIPYFEQRDYVANAQSFGS